jgi:hypothetical protein
MTEHRRPDPVAEIVASGREITRDDADMLWSDLISGRYTWQETSERALALIETVNVAEHIVNWGLMELYYLWQPGTARDAESQVAKREAWRQVVRAKAGGGRPASRQRRRRRPTWVRRSPPRSDENQ